MNKLTLILNLVALFIGCNMHLMSQSNDAQLKPQFVLASFTLANGSNDTICAGQSVTFSNTSVAATSYTWTFQGGSPATSNLTNPTVSYSVPAAYNVILKARNDTTAEEHTAGYIHFIKVYAVTFTITSLNPSCNTCSNGNITITTPSGPYSYPPFTFSWTPNVSSSAAASNLNPGCFTISVADAKGCDHTSGWCLYASGIETYNDINQRISLFPNPVKEQLKVDFDGGHYNYRVYDSFGMQMEASNHLKGSTKLDMTQYAPGVYVFELICPEGIGRKKIIVR